MKLMVPNLGPCVHVEYENIEIENQDYFKYFKKPKEIIQLPSVKSQAT